jgi:hypothetical protein
VPAQVDDWNVMSSQNKSKPNKKTKESAAKTLPKKELQINM